MFQLIITQNPFLFRSYLVFVALAIASRRAAFANKSLGLNGARVLQPGLCESLHDASEQGGLRGRERRSGAP